MARTGGSLAALRNVGPVTARRLADLGISDEAELRKVDPIAAYRRLKLPIPGKRRPSPFTPCTVR